MASPDVTVSSDAVYEIQIQLLTNQIGQLTRDLAVSQAVGQNLAERLQKSEDALTELQSS